MRNSQAQSSTSSDQAIGPQAFTPTRDAGLATLHDFLPRAGRVYAEQRGADHGPQHRHNVSQLSPWLRCRLITEDDVVRATLAQHGPHAAQKFVQEVLWRTYWKGWLQLRPQVWTDYLHECERMRRLVDDDTAIAARLNHAESGDTGIDCFDAWARELVDTGTLHNHARMWFASIWIFTLQLPWSLGADFFLRHLRDGDPASNTLSWRWVAGLQTRGKAYLATADNIARHTDGRYSPKGLATSLPDIDAPAPPEPIVLPPATPLSPQQRALLLVTPEDLHPESLGLNRASIRGVVLVHRCSTPQAWPWGRNAAAFVDGAIEDAAQRCTAHFDVEATIIDEPSAAALRDAAHRVDVDQVMTSRAPVGPMADALPVCGAGLESAGIALATVQRDWDTAFWPHATRGFFAFRKRIDATLAELGIADSRT